MRWPEQNFLGVVTDEIWPHSMAVIDLGDEDRPLWVLSE
jgi:hypothetical protein